jgi:prepilin-type N-terminal cleavage/methylation domain-containing protein
MKIYIDVRKKGFDPESGLTLIELLVAIVVSGILASAIFGIFDSNNRLYNGEQKVVYMHGNANVAIETLARSLRHIGYDPKEAGADVFGLTDSSFSASSAASIVSNSDIYFTADLWDGDLAAPAGGSRSSSSEFFAYRLSGTDLERANVTDAAGTIGSWSVIAPNITSLVFVYRYADGTTSDLSGLPDNSVDARSFENVRSIEINLTARTDGNHNLTGTPSTETVSTTIKLRNNV